jgi:protein TonB
MSARAILLPDGGIGDDFKRWSLCAAIVVAAHFGVMASYLLFASQEPTGAAMAPAVLIDLAPMPVAPASLVDLAPGPEMVESPAQPEPAKPDEAQPEVFEPLPRIETPAVVTLPLAEPKPKDEPKPVDEPELKKTQEVVKADQTPPAPQTTAPLRSVAPPAPVARAPSPGSVESQAQIMTWRDLVVTRLQNAKRYPSSAEANREQGVVTLNFSVNRNGKVISRSIAKSSGHASLDQEVLALVQRAQPLPPFPPAMTQSVVHLSVPIRFSLK